MLHRWLFLLAYLGFLTWASLAPATTIAKFPLSFPYADKLFHFLIYGGLVAVARWTFTPRSGADVPSASPSLVGTGSTPVPNPPSSPSGADVPSASPASRLGPASIPVPNSPLVGTRSTRVPNPSLVLAAISYGFLMELIQSFLVSYGRSFELLDVVANTLGALTFWLLTAPRAKPKG